MWHTSRTHVHGTAFDTPGFAESFLSVYGPSRVPWATQGVLLAYVYHADRPNLFGQELYINKNDPTSVTNNMANALVPPKGRWVNYKCQQVMNTFNGSGGDADGILRYYMDGTLIFERTNLRWVDTGTSGDYSWKVQPLFYNFAGGGADWPIPQTQSHYYDNLIVQTDAL